MSTNELKPSLYLAARGHIYAGLCPDDTQPDAIDPECAACRLLVEARAATEADKLDAQGYSHE